MLINLLSVLELNPHYGLGLAILILGALFTASVGVSIFSFYMDEYWENEEYRNELRYGSKKNKSQKSQKA